MIEQKIAVPFSKLYLGGKERDYVEQAILSDSVGGSGHFTITCEKVIKEIIGSTHVFLTSSCSSALHLAFDALHLPQGSEIILPSFAFASCASILLSLRLKPVFADSLPDTLNIDPQHVKKLIGRRTGAILIIHYGGIACEMDELVNISQNYDLPLIEDAAHALFGKYKSRVLGSYGSFSVFSFDRQKNLTCGEGGALAINDSAYSEAAEICYHRGTNRANFLRGDSENYDWVGSGGNYSPSELQAAFLLAQFESSSAIQNRRREITSIYNEKLREWADRNKVILASAPKNTESAYHIYYLLFPSKIDRDAALLHLRSYGIGAESHYLPLNISPFGKKLGGGIGQCPVSENLSQRLIRLPLNAALSEDDVTAVIGALMVFNCAR